MLSPKPTVYRLSKNRKKKRGASIFIYQKTEHENTTNGKTSRTRICHVSLENQKFQLDRSKKVGRRSINQVRQCLVQAFHQAVELTLPARFQTGNLLRPPHHLKAEGLVFRGMGVVPGLISWTYLKHPQTMAVWGASRLSSKGLWRLRIFFQSKSTVMSMFGASMFPFFQFQSHFPR